MLQRPRRLLTRLVAAVACAGWSLFSTGCSHSVAQRSPWDWSVQRVLTDQPQAASARPRPVTRAGFYFLAREWDPRGQIAPETAAPGELFQAYLASGEMLGFRQTPDGRTMAIANGQEIAVTIDTGVNHVWYREKNGWHEAGDTTTLLLTVLGTALVVGVVVLVANSDNGSIELSF